MKVAVFCGSRMPDEPRFIEAAIALGNAIAQGGHTLIYGGAKVGSMGVLADTVLDCGGEVIGVMPQILKDKELIHERLTETIIVENMSVRKTVMNDMSDVFIALPGGCGTMDEIFEVITLNQIGYFDKPVGFVNVLDYYGGIQNYLKEAVKYNYTKEQDALIIKFSDDPKELLENITK